MLWKGENLAECVHKIAVRYFGHSLPRQVRTFILVYRLNYTYKNGGVIPKYQIQKYLEVTLLSLLVCAPESAFANAEKNSPR